jgi:3D (Asp-Asp-Asp) domain-containing protein
MTTRIIMAIIVALMLALLATQAIRVLTPAQDDPELREIRLQLDRIQCDVEGLRARYADRVTVTSYSSERRQTDSTPHITAINTRVRPGTEAVSRDLLERGWAFGRKVWIEGMGVYTIEDVMHPRKTRQIDVWRPMDAGKFRHECVLAVVIR